MKRHRLPEPHLQKLLDPMEIVRCGEWHTGCRSKVVYIVLPRIRINDVLTELYMVDALEPI
jgi:hypothetical protein